jgi:hypothetical protein
MSLNFKRLLFLAVMIAGVGVIFMFTQPLTPTPPEKVVAEPTPLPAKPPKQLPGIPQEMLGQAQAFPSEEQLEEERRVEQQQITAAKQALFDKNPQMRVAGIEQLAGFISTDSEKSVRDVLLSDKDVEVRAVAAMQLYNFKQPSTETINALLAALQDEAPVSENALNTLANQFQVQESNSQQYMSVSKALQKKLQDKHVSKTIKESIRYLLQDIGVLQP